MIEIKGNVTYSDGTTQEFVGGPWSLSQWERYAQRNNMDSDAAKSPMTWMMFVGYASVHRETWGKCEGYEAWSARVIDIDLDTDDANPTKPAPSGG